MLFKLGSRNVHHRRNKMIPVVLLPWQQLCPWSGLVRTEIPSVHLSQVLSTPSNLTRRVKTIREACLLQARPSVALKRVRNRDIWFLTEREWSQESYHGNGITGVILFLLRFILLVPSWKITASIFLEIFFSQYFTILVSQSTTLHHHLSILHNAKTLISLKWKKI